ncbi:MAG: 3-hydroxyacyl-ACP dehydratase FabZ [Sneathiella sp.]|nr:3-hydroxyacyl-ACP dehydratase FabZ [Sneathiella sp.]
MSDHNDNTTVETLDIQDILKMLPHRYPLLLVDRVKDIVLGVSATGIKNVTMNEPHFQGHFPDNPIMPGVLIVEAMAQTAGVLVVRSTDGDTAGMQVLFTSIENAKFRKPVRPGDVLHMKITKTQNRGPFWKFSGIVEVDGKKVAEAKFAAMVSNGK